VNSQYAKIAQWSAANPLAAVGFPAKSLRHASIAALYARAGGQHGRSWRQCTLFTNEQK
jgi:hypothetical protein